MTVAKKIWVLSLEAGKNFAGETIVPHSEAPWRKPNPARNQRLLASRKWLLNERDWSMMAKPIKK